MQRFTDNACKTEDAKEYSHLSEASPRPAIVVVIRQRGSPPGQRTFVELDATRALIRRGWQVSHLPTSQQDKLYNRDLSLLGRGEALLLGTVWKSGCYESDDPHSLHVQVRSTKVHVEASVVGEGEAVFRTRHIVVRGCSQPEFKKLSEDIADFVEGALG